MLRRLTATTILAGSLLAPLTGAETETETETEITLGRFFSAYEEAGSDIAAATGEACIIQSIINAFSEADNDITVNTLPTDWGNFYDQIKAAYAGGNPPDVHEQKKHGQGEHNVGNEAHGAHAERYDRTRAAADLRQAVGRRHAHDQSGKAAQSDLPLEDHLLQLLI